MPSISEAVERAAVANGGKNLIDRGPRCYERSPGELLPQTFPSEPSTAVEQQQANPLPDLPPRSPKAQSLRMLTMAGSARLHRHRLVRWKAMGTSSSLCERGRRGSYNTRQSSAARAPYPSCAHSPRGHRHAICTRSQQHKSSLVSDL